MLALIGCAAPEWPPEDPPGRGGTITARELWEQLRPVGSRVTLEPLVVTSPRAEPGDRFVAADPAGGPASGVEIGLGGVLSGWPPPVGTLISLTGTVERSVPPRVRLARDDDAEVLGTGEPPLPWPWRDDPALELALVEVDDLRVTSDVDPLGWADTDGPVGIGGWFGVSPGYDRQGDLVGILSEGRVSARTPEDWSGTVRGKPPLPATIADLPSLPGGTPVVLEDLVPASPWTRDGRWAVLQDADGLGVWLDAEAWSTPLPAEAGTWTGEVRRQPWGVTLRSWRLPVVTGPARAPVVLAPAEDEPLVDASIVALTLTGLGPADAWGDRASDGPQVTDAFEDLSTLTDPADVVAAVVGGTVVAPF